MYYIVPTLLVGMGLLIASMEVYARPEISIFWSISAVGLLAYGSYGYWVVYDFLRAVRRAAVAAAAAKSPRHGAGASPHSR
jgi:hypothetical protein